MKKLLLGELAFLIAICLFGAAAAPVAPVAGEKAEQPAVRAAADPSTVVAKIGSYTITREELEKQFMMELRPQDYDSYYEQAEPVTVKGTLEEMVAEKAMVIEARKQGGLDDERNRGLAKRFRDKKLANLLAMTYLQDKVTASDSEIAQKMKADPKLDKVQAKAAIERDKARSLWDQYYLQIYKRLNVKKLTENYPTVGQAHHRLLYRPKQARSVGFIRNSQVKEELTPQEKKTVLATYDKGQITLGDWFVALCDIVPPRRPRNMKDTKVVEQLLTSALQMPLLVVEAESLGLDKNEELLKQVRDYEDRMLLGSAKLAQYKDAKEPTAEEKTAYFNKNQEKFAASESLKIDLIWCDDLAKAKKAKAELDEGKDFEKVKQEHSLEKQLKPFTTRPGSEGLFWKDLEAGDPNETVGPVKGFYRQGVKWRIVKILEKKPGTPKEYAANMDPQIKDKIMTEQRDALLAKYSKELLRKYTYQFYLDRIKDIDPLVIP
ncbi:MAG: peptidyl-prolyl cis-trans isomerase [Planctomycetes bacterium]|nr:peptidyl-prolyl cis-trans isomerase [Planctomycetota bacterium]